LLSKSRLRYGFGHVRGSEAAHHGSLRGSTEILEVIFLKKAQQGWDGAPPLGECKNYHQRWGLPMGDNVPPCFLSVADGSNLPQPLTAPRREKRRMKSNPRSREQRFQYKFDDPTRHPYFGRRNRKWKCGLPFSLPASSISVAISGDKVDLSKSATKYPPRGFKFQCFFLSRSSRNEHYICFLLVIMSQLFGLASDNFLH
jgi:hypothetical protein